MPPESATDGSPTYEERLRVPLRWWVQATMLLASLWLAFVVAMPFWAATAAAALLLGLVASMFGWFGKAALVVRDGVLHAGTAYIPVALLGEPEPLDADGTRRVLGVEADARAFLVTRPWLKRSVRVPVLDPADPAPYWLLSTRRPQLLVEALERASTSGGHPAG